MSPGNAQREKEMAERAKRERLAYVGTLAAGLVHEMRNPLHAVLMSAQLLEEEVAALPEERCAPMERKARRIHTEVRSIVRTLEEFLAFARPPKMDAAPTDLNHVLREMLEFCEPEFAAAAVTLESHLAEDMYPVVMDRQQFSHLMLNLLRNAREAIAEADHDDGVVTVTTRERDERIEVLIDDNGVGIPPGDEEKIFEVFHTTKDQGTGLGLGIVRRIVEEHGGDIVAEELPEPGARFRITLPRGKFLEFSEDSA